jgi:hypothetical protein
MSAELVDGFASITGFGDKDHVRLARQYRGDPFAQHGMIIHRQNSNLISSRHNLHLDVETCDPEAADFRPADRYALPAGTVSSTSVPDPGRLQKSNLAPIFSERSRIPCKPQ